MKLVFTAFLCIFFASSYTKSVNDTISEEDAKRHIYYLASDKLRGRVNFTNEQLAAAIYISKEFNSYGLQPLPPFKCFYQPFLSVSGYSLPAFSACDTLSDSVLYNIVGLIPGKSNPDEIIIFSAHYDHVEKGLMGQTGEIYNGANDDASGTTAVLMLAQYFAMRHDNERTIMFCLFAGEELGLLGSHAFVNRISADKVKAVINIEMIGKKNWAGKNSFVVTGSEYSDLKVILKKNLQTENVKVRSDRLDQTYLFMRSDNYSFAKKGIPAHSIMCSDDSEPCYHKPCDDAERIDIENMTTIIKAIAKGCSTLISGKDTPRRIKL